MTTATLPRRLSLPFRRLASRGVLYGFGITLAAGLLVLIATSLVVGIVGQGVAMPRVSVGGIEVGGLDRASAEARLAAGLPSLTSGRATIVTDQGEAVVSYAEIGRGYEMQAMLDAAFAVGRGSDPLADGLGRLRTLLVGSALPAQVHAYDADAIDRIAAQVASQFSVPVVDASVERDGTDFTVVASEDGRVLEPNVVRDALAAFVVTPDPADARIELSPQLVEPEVTTADAESAAESARGMAARLSLTIEGAPADEAPLVVTGGSIANWIAFGVADGVYGVELDEAAIATAFGNIKTNVDQEPQNATFALSGGQLSGVVPAEDGREMDLDASVSAFVEGLRERGTGASVAGLGLVVEVAAPEFTTAAAQAALPQMRQVSTWTTYYEPNEGNGFGNNINIPAFDIDGHTLAPGEWFSFWDGVGPITAERGFTYGGVIIGGRSVRGGAIGGGICSTSTTLFNAAMRAGLEIGDRMNHYYYIPRYPDGLDATVYMDENYTQDMTFRNDTDSPIVIRGYGGGGWVRFDIWMVPTGRSVVLTDPLISNRRNAIETTQVDSSMAPGSARRVEYPHDGHDVSRTRYVYDANGNVVHQNTWFSSYRTVNGITVVGPSAAAPPPPSGTPAPSPSP